MNSITWKIEPNLLAWTLLGIATASLVAIAIRLWAQQQTIQQTQTPNRGSVVAWIALVLAVISVLCVLFRPSAPNNASLLITALGVLVTCIVAWNIWQTIDTKETVGKAEEASKRIDELQKIIEATKSSYQSYVFYVDAMLDFGNGQYSTAFRNIASSLETAIEYEISFSRFGRRALDFMDECIEKGSSSFDGHVDAHIELVEMLLKRISKNKDYFDLALPRLQNIKSKLEAMRK